jgi:hypothetical protein
MLGANPPLLERLQSPAGGEDRDHELDVLFRSALREAWGPRE